jgi:hypothetical protein
MTLESSDHGLQTLTQWLAGLRAADPCPCCGAPLTEEAAYARHGDREIGERLVCEGCGCRLEPADAAVGCLAADAYGMAA